MLMVSMNLSFPQSLSSLKAGVGLSGSSRLPHPKFQLEFCSEISSVISSFLPRKAKHKRSGVWHKKLGLLARKRSSEPELQLLSLKIREHLFHETLNPRWEVLSRSWPRSVSTWLPRSCRQLTKSSIGGCGPSAGCCGRERCSFRSSRVKGAWIWLGWHPVLQPKLLQWLGSSSPVGFIVGKTVLQKQRSLGSLYSAEPLIFSEHIG